MNYQPLKVIEGLKSTSLADKSSDENQYGSIRLALWMGRTAANSTWTAQARAWLTQGNWIKTEAAGNGFSKQGKVTVSDRGSGLGFKWEQVGSSWCRCGRFLSSGRTGRGGEGPLWAKWEKRTTKRGGGAGVEGSQEGPAGKAKVRGWALSPLGGGRGGA